MPSLPEKSCMVFKIFVRSLKWTNEYVHLTRPDKTHHILCCNCNAFRCEAIFHGWISLHNVSSLSHSPDVVYVGMLEFQRKGTPWFEEKHVTSVLECATDLRGVQSEL